MGGEATNERIPLRIASTKGNPEGSGSFRMPKRLRFPLREFLDARCTSRESFSGHPPGPMPSNVRVSSRIPPAVPIPVSCPFVEGIDRTWIDLDGKGHGFDRRCDVRPWPWRTFDRPTHVATTTQCAARTKQARQAWTGSRRAWTTCRSSNALPSCTWMRATDVARDDVSKPLLARVPKHRRRAANGCDASIPCLFPTRCRSQTSCARVQPSYARLPPTTKRCSRRMRRSSAPSVSSARRSASFRAHVPSHVANKHDWNVAAWARIETSRRALVSLEG